MAQSSHYPTAGDVHGKWTYEKGYWWYQPPTGGNWVNITYSGSKPDARPGGPRDLELRKWIAFAAGLQLSLAGPSIGAQFGVTGGLQQLGVTIGLASLGGAVAEAVSEPSSTGWDYVRSFGRGMLIGGLINMAWGAADELLQVDNALSQPVWVNPGLGIQGPSGALAESQQITIWDVLKPQWWPW